MAASVCAAGALAAAPSAYAGSQSFGAPGSHQFTVPEGVTSLHVVARGASGASPPGSSAVTGGFGALVGADLAVAPGQTLVITVGAIGGADAGDGGSGGDVTGGDGGGASDVRIQPGTLSDRVVVAAGGGGGGGDGVAAGGDGGADGDDGSSGAGGGGAGGVGTGGAGGVGIGTAGDGADGTFGSGGDGGDTGAASGTSGPGGGGGGGWYGGGGGGSSSLDGGGGGGGSNHAGPSVTNFTEQAASVRGNGSVVLAWISSDLTFGKVKKNRKRGTAKLTITVEEPGTAELAGRKVKPATVETLEAGAVKLPVKPDAGAKRALKEKGKVRVKVDVTFTATGADPNTETLALKLVRKP